MRRSLPFSLAFLALTAIPVVAPAQQPIPAGAELQVNTYTTSEQSKPSVTPDGSEGFVVVWESGFPAGLPSPPGPGVDGSELGIALRRFTSEGSPVGEELVVNTYTTGNQFQGTSALLGAGGFVVVWGDDRYSIPEGASYIDLFAQRFSSDGSANGGEFRINADTTGVWAHPSVAPLGGGGFVVVWLDCAPSCFPGDAVLGRRFDANGAFLGDEFQVNTYTTAGQYFPTVAALTGGGFIVAWADDDLPGRPASVQAQRYGSDGNPLAPPFQVNTNTTYFTGRAEVAELPSGSFVVVWSSVGTSGDGPDGSEFGVVGRRFDSSGSPLGEEFLVNSYTTDDQILGGVIPEGSGGFVVTWESSGQDGFFESVHGRRFASDGSGLGGEFQVNTYTSNGQANPAISADGSGGFVVVFQDEWYYDTGNDTDGDSINLRRFALPAIFADGFETGDTAAWSSAVP